MFGALNPPGFSTSSILNAGRYLQVTEIPSFPEKMHEKGNQDAKYKYGREAGELLAKLSYFAGHIPTPGNTAW